MRAFKYCRARSVLEAISIMASNPNASFIAGGTNLLDLMKEDVAQPSRLIDITRLPLSAIEVSANGGLRIGALARNSDIAYHPEVEARYPLLSRALLAGASPQVRNMASAGGNLMQRTRCYYFYDTTAPCNKRKPGSGCSAIGGVNRIHAILGTTEVCIATHPSDMCVALMALDAVVIASSPKGERAIPFAEFHRLPGDSPEVDTHLRRDELITAIDLPPRGFADKYTYLKIRDRASFAFALISVAVGFEVRDGKIFGARVALGGVAHKPWRDTEGEALLHGHEPNPRIYNDVADAILSDAKTYGGNDFKILLARHAIVRALSQAAAGTPQSNVVKRIL